MEEMNKNQVKGRILQIFKYLQALDQLRNPVIRDIQLQPWGLWMKHSNDSQLFMRVRGSLKKRSISAAGESSMGGNGVLTLVNFKIV